MRYLLPPPPAATPASVTNEVDDAVSAAVSDGASPLFPKDLAPGRFSALACSAVIPNHSSVMQWAALRVSR